MSDDKTRVVIVSEGKRFRECIQGIKGADGTWVTETFHQEKRGKEWGPRKSIKEYNKKRKNERR